MKPSNHEIAMRYPASTPTQFSGAKSFVEANGNAIWCELTDTYNIGQPIPVADAARKLETLNGYANPARYLRAVLKAIQADYFERPDEYENIQPFMVIGKTMAKIIL